MPFDYGINNAIILSAHNSYRPFIASLGVSGGRISYIGEKKIYLEDAREILDASGKILMPGLVNGHCHGDMTFARGFGDDKTLAEQNEAFADTNWFHSLITDEDRYYSRLLTYAEALLSGTTFIMENMYWGLGEKSAAAMALSGIRGALAEDIRIDFMDEDAFVPQDQLQMLCDLCRQNGFSPVIGSVSEESFDLSRLNQIRDHVNSLACLQTCHLAETDWRVQIIRDRFGTTPVDFLAQNDLLHDRLIISHAVHVSENEARAMAKHGVKVVNTPLCEMKIADGIAPIPAYLKAGVIVGLGTDGAMWNNSLDIFREMKGMALLHTVNGGIRTLKKSDILDMATINGAKIFGLENEMGTIEIPKSADFILIDATSPHMMPLRTGGCENVGSNVVFSAVGSDVTDVFIQGRHIVQNRVLTTIDLRDLSERVSAASMKIARHYG